MIADHEISQMQPDEVDVDYDEHHLTITVRPNPTQVRLQRLVLFASGIMGLFFAVIAVFTTSPSIGAILFLSICVPFIWMGVQAHGDERQIELSDGELRSSYDGTPFGDVLAIEAIHSVWQERQGRRHLVLVEMDNGAVHELGGGFREQNARYIVWLLQRALFGAL